MRLKQAEQICLHFRIIHLFGLRNLLLAVIGRALPASISDRYVQALDRQNYGRQKN